MALSLILEVMTMKFASDQFGSDSYMLYIHNYITINMVTILS